MALWSAAFDQAIREARFDIAERIVERMGDAGLVKRAYLSIVKGDPDEAVKMVGSNKDHESRSIAAWALYCMGMLPAAANAWKESPDEDERRFAVLLSTMKRATPHDLAELKALETSSNLRVSSSALKLLSKHYMEREDYEKALSSARRAEWHFPNDLELKIRVAQCAFSQKNKELCVAKSKEILEIDPEIFEALEFLGHYAAEEEKFEDAKAYYRRAVAAEPLAIMARYALGEIEFDEGNLEEAERLWMEAYGIDPNDFDTIAALAELSWAKDDMLASLEYHLKLKQIGFSSKDEEEEHYDFIGYIYAEILLGGNTSYDDEAGAFLKEAAAKYSSNPIFMLYDARRHLAMKRIEKAEELIARLMKNCPNMADALFENGKIRIAKGDEQAGLEMIIRAAQMSSDPFYFKEAGIIHFDRGAWAESEKYFKLALSKGFEDTDTLIALRYALVRQQKYAAAENVVRQLMKIFPEALQMKVTFAETKLYRGEYDEAIAVIGNEVIDKAVEFNEEEAENGDSWNVVMPFELIHWVLGLALLFKKDFGPAADILEVAEAKSSDSNEDHFAYFNVLIEKALHQIDIDEAIPAKIRRRLVRVLTRS